MRCWPRAWRRRGLRAASDAAAKFVDNASHHSYFLIMRAITHTSVAAAPDYTLRVPSQVQLLLAAGALGGLGGGALLIAAPDVLGAVDYALIGVGMISAAAALALRVVTSPARRERAREQMLDAIAWRGDERVLDVGCGNGFVLIDVAKRLSAGTAVGIDVWKAEAGEQSAELARRNAYLEGVADRVEIKSADARQMPFPSQSFDVIVSSLMLHHAGGRSDRHRVLAEMLRVLKPGGTIKLYDAFPLIGDAAAYLRGNGATSVRRTGGLTPTLTAIGG
jgi:arsenite methyltransferase